MLKRQRVLLRLLKQAEGKTVSRMELTKWCFLLREETPSCASVRPFPFYPGSPRPASGRGVGGEGPAVRLRWGVSEATR